MSELGRSIISSRLLILQSKRLIMISIQRRVDQGVASPEMYSRYAQLRLEAATAQNRYATAIIHWGSPEQNDFWVVAYSRLIEKAHLVIGRMRAAAPGLPLNERYQLSADVEMMEHLSAGWAKSMREQMSAEVA
jgi:hypothetical protein